MNDEPPAVKTYDERFLRQFGTVVTCQDTRHPKVLRTQQSLFWSLPRVEEEDALPPPVAYQDYDRLCRHEPLIKTETISAIAFAKTFTAGHRERLVFAQRLKKRMGDYFPTEALIVISISDFEKAVATIEAGIASGLYESSEVPRCQAKELILNTYNLFPALSRLIGSMSIGAQSEQLMLMPDAHFRGGAAGHGRRFLRRLGRVVHLHGKQ